MKSDWLYRTQNSSGDSGTDCDTPPEREECNFIENVKEGQNPGDRFDVA